MDMSRKLTWSVLILAAVLAAAAVVLALTLGTARGKPEATPQTTVRDFLGAAVVDNDGGAACAYLTARARESFERHSSGPDCTTYFGSAQLTLGHLQLNSDRRLGMVTYDETARGAERVVRVSHGGQSVDFVLRRANGPEADEFRAPATPWRITTPSAFGCCVWSAGGQD
jgi:hypothetical protein